jgi:hypothetical protein
MKKNSELNKTAPPNDDAYGHLEVQFFIIKMEEGDSIDSNDQ